MAVVTPTDRPKTVRKHCEIELFVALFVLSLCPFDISAGVGAFIIGLSQISSPFFLWPDVVNNKVCKTSKVFQGQTFLPVIRVIIDL